MKTPFKTASLSVLALALTLGGFPGMSFANEIGSVAAVNRDIDGTPPGGASRSLLLGDRLIANERLISSPLGSGQVLFLDQTSLTVSPNSDIVLDQYVYDPDTEVGAIGITVTKGVMRLVGGRITKTTDAIVQTPTATIGIRGGISLVVTDENNQTTVMHVAGEYTKVKVGDQELTMSRSNALAQTGGDGIEYLGVASAEQIAALYNQMQGGGGGSDEEVTSEDAEGSGIAEANSEEPNAVTDAPISTSGEKPAEDGSAEVLQLNLASNTDVIVPVEEQFEQSSNPFANFIGGALLVDNEPFIDADGTTIQNPSAQNLLTADEGTLATSFEQGSLIVNLENGDRAKLPTPVQNGFFEIDPSQTSSTAGQLSGAGFADSTSGLLAYYFEVSNGNRGFIFGANPGPTQLRTINSNNANFRATAFNILPDLHITSSQTTMPFLPEGLGEVFDNGRQAQLFLLSQPNQALFGQGSGFGTSNGNRWLLPMFSISGNGANQNFLLSVGAVGVANNGTNAPDLTSFARGSFRIGGEGTAFRLQPVVGTTAVGDGAGGPTVFGSDDRYLVLGNSSAYQNDDNPDEEVTASFFSNIETGEFEAYGNLHLAQRANSQNLGPNARIAIGSNAAAYAAETGRTGSNSDRFLSFGYAANAASFRGSTGGTEKMLFRTAAIDNGGAASFQTNGLSGSVVLRMDEVLGGNVAGGQNINGANLAFGGNRGAVIDTARFGLRDHNNPQSLTNVLVDSGERATAIQTSQGELTGRPDDQFGHRALRGALLSHGLADAASIYPAGTDITPQFLTWGWWTGQFRFANNDPNTFQNARLQYALGTWVAGNRTDVLPMTGTATYNGPVTVNFVNDTGSNVVDFVDGGRFQLNWNFASGNGNAGFQNVGNLPNFIVPVDDISGRLGVNDYGGQTTISAAGDIFNARVDGSFFDGPQANDARATAGSIRIQNSSQTINGTGTFWGER